MARKPRTDAERPPGRSTALVAGGTAPRGMEPEAWRTLHRSDIERALHSLEAVLGTVDVHASRRARESLVDAYKQLDRLWQFAEKG